MLKLIKFAMDRRNIEQLLLHSLSKKN